jgi:hypothetical protein
MLCLARIYIKESASNDSTKNNPQKNRELRQKALNERDIKIFHSWSYHRFFEGYKEVKVLDANGRPSIKRIYTGTWFKQNLSTSKYVLLRTWYVLLFAGIIFMLIQAASLQKESGQVQYLVIPEIATTGGIFLLFYVLFVNYLFVPKRMTLHDYRSSAVLIKQAAMLLSICFGLDAFMQIVYVISHRLAAHTSEVWAAYRFMIAGIGSFMILWTERRVSYLEIENEVSEQVGGIEIES